MVIPVQYSYSVLNVQLSSKNIAAEKYITAHIKFGVHIYAQVTWHAKILMARSELMKFIIYFFLPAAVVWKSK